MPDDRALLFATDTGPTRALAAAVDAELAPLPDALSIGEFEAWRKQASEGPPRARVIVAVWQPQSERRDLVELDRDAWSARFEAPYLLWNFALGAAARRCADGGSIVAVAQAPAALDAPGHTPELAIADGVLALVRSVAAAEGGRGVRANLVTTPIDLVEGSLVAPAPPLDGFPGTIEGHVAGAVRSFLSADAAGLTGRVLATDGGRSL